MVRYSTKDLCSEVIRIYRDLDRKTTALQVAAGLRCPSGCGACCESPEVEATVLEALPIAKEIYRRREQEAVLYAIKKSENRGDLVCVLYRPDRCIPGNGRCRYYKFRPLSCRLFGFASRRNKFGDIELCTCTIIKERTPEAVHRAGTRISEGLDVAVYQDSFMRVASIDPSKGYRRLPINLTLKETLEYLYWTRLTDLRDSKAA